MQYPCLKRLPRFEYLAPRTMEEAIGMLAKYGNDARLMAGGTDLVLNLKRRKETPKYVIGLKNIAGLDRINYSPGRGLRFGPLVKVHEIETSSVIQEKFRVLAQAAKTLGSVQVRNLATVVGNLCSALPSADMAPGLIVLGAELKLVGQAGGRSINVENFFVAPGKSALASDEIVAEVAVPEPPPGSRMAYLKYMQRSAMDLSIVGAAVLAVVEQGICKNARICLGTAGPVPARAEGAENILKDKNLNSEIIETAAAVASEECSPRSSMRASADYRREIVKVLVSRALSQIKDGANLR
jgi:carbon-monoxide dehydrogenase medium subunit